MFPGLPKGVTPPSHPSRDPSVLQFERDLRGAAAGAAVPLTVTRESDQWAQDIFESGYVSKPGPGGVPHVMRVMLRSPNLYDAKTHALRPAGRYVFTHLRGKNVGAVQQIGRTAKDRGPGNDRYNSTGNLTPLPPSPGAPLGRLLIGGARSGHTPDRTFLRLLASQGVQKPLYVDSSWLEIGHVDEFLGVVPATTPRGWALAVADPTGARRLLERLRAEGHGRAALFAEKRGGSHDDGSNPPARRTVDALLRDRRLTAANARASREIAKGLRTVRRATGLTEADIVRVPSIYEAVRAKGRGSVLSPLLPGIVNGQPLAGGVVASPKPQGPVIDGRDAFEVAAEAAYGRVGVHNVWIEDWAFAHVGGGDVHCVTNAWRDPSTDRPWWRAGA
jgi:protein-arginine deiminase